MDLVTAFGITAPSAAWKAAGFLVYADGGVREERFGAYGDLLLARLEGGTGNDLVLARVVAIHQARNEAHATRQTVEKLAGAMHHLAYAAKKSGALAGDVRALSETIAQVQDRLGLALS